MRFLGVIALFCCFFMAGKAKDIDLNANWRFRTRMTPAAPLWILTTPAGRRSKFPDTGNTAAFQMCGESAGTAAVSYLILRPGFRGNW